eukprot:TRINITY_DN81594_c0_g1_i1.p1 TRINITY_DN81594_c0_g1~~TRINITY_DN81594_c0_g1_i1.p1  ORF type:complete len:594 (+),score=134.70 TRINITY_DN81594_c0_g1_i1:58-1839(+)
MITAFKVQQLCLCFVFTGTLSDSTILNDDCVDEETSLLQTHVRAHRTRSPASCPDDVGVTPKNALAAEVMDGRLDYLAGGPYCANEVAAVAANMVNNMFLNGTVLASPSRTINTTVNDYYYMWQRDSAITMRTLLRVQRGASGGLADVLNNQSSGMRRQFVAYADLVRKQWEEPSPNINCPAFYKDKIGWCSTHGEPKFFVNGSVFDKPWGRPQNDGAALAATFLADLMDEALDAGLKEPWMDGVLSDGGKSGSLQGALQFVLHFFLEGSFEPWEEIYGRHFFLAAVQRKALAAAAALAKRLGYQGSLPWPKMGSNQWARGAKQLGDVMLSFFDAAPAHEGPFGTVVRATFGQQYPGNDKCFFMSVNTSNHTGPCALDAQTLLASMYALPSSKDIEFAGAIFPPSSPQMLRTAATLVASMGPTYLVNKDDDEKGLPGVLIGRYPGDAYDGAGEQGTCNLCGNPWFVTTHGLAETLYQAAKLLAEKKQDSDDTDSTFSAEDVKSLFGQIAGSKECLKKHGVSKILICLGDGILERAKSHTLSPGMHMSEQIERGGMDQPLPTGAQMGVPDLTWSYGSLLDALASRAEAVTATGM